MDYIFEYVAVEENKRRYFRISPRSVSVELPEHEVVLVDISVGGAKFQVMPNTQLEDQVLVLDLGNGVLLDVPFQLVERKGNICRVAFVRMGAAVEAALSKYILNWQQRRAFLNTERKDS